MKPPRPKPPTVKFSSLPKEVRDEYKFRGETRYRLPEWCYKEQNAHKKLGEK